MIFYGLLRNLVIRWCGDAEGTLQNDLIGGEGGIVSAEPAVRMQRLARLAGGHRELILRLTRGTVDEIRAALAGHQEFVAAVREYLAKFGDRTVNELKLESATLHDDPLPLFRAVGSLAQQRAAAGRTEPARGVRFGGRSAAERIEAARPRGSGRASPAARCLRVGPSARAAAGPRSRKPAASSARDFSAAFAGSSSSSAGGSTRSICSMTPRDVFYLEVDEVLAFAEGRSTTTDLRALAALRKRRIPDGYADSAAAGRSVRDRGSVVPRPRLRARGGPGGTQATSGKASVARPGIVRGPVRIVTDPATADLEQRAILVAEHTDPGWIMVFPVSAGLLVERGSLLSHAAIVARELGIPADRVAPRRHALAQGR